MEYLVVVVVVVGGGGGGGGGGVVIVIVIIVINCFICMTASFYSIAKTCIWQSKYRTNSTNNNLGKSSYITNKE